MAKKDKLWFYKAQVLSVSFLRDMYLGNTSATQRRDTLKTFRNLNLIPVQFSIKKFSRFTQIIYHLTILKIPDILLKSLASVYILFYRSKRKIY